MAREWATPGLSKGGDGGAQTLILLSGGLTSVIIGPILFGPLAGVGKLLGHRSTYPRPDL